MKTILTVIGARPQFVKAAVLSRLIRQEYSDRFREILVHTEFVKAIISPGSYKSFLKEKEKTLLRNNIDGINNKDKRH